MSWVRLDDHFPEHPKVADLSDGAFRVHVAALCYCARNLTDGKLSAGAVRMMGGTSRQLQELVTAGVWETDGPGWLVHDYLDYNPTREQVENERATARERMAGVRGNKSRSSPDVRPNINGSSASPYPVPVPVPVPGDPLPAVANGTDDDAPEHDIGFRDRLGSMTVAYGRNIDRRMLDEFTQIAEDETLDDINASIRQCRKDNVPCYPSNIRERLPAAAAVEAAALPARWRLTEESGPVWIQRRTDKLREEGMEKQAAKDQAIREWQEQRTG